MHCADDVVDAGLGESDVLLLAASDSKAAAVELRGAIAARREGVCPLSAIARTDTQNVEAAAIDGIIQVDGRVGIDRQAMLAEIGPSHPDGVARASGGRAGAGAALAAAGQCQR